MTSSSPPPPPFLALPIELLLKIFDHLPAADITRVLSTSRVLRVHARSEHVFAPLCAAYGVRDVGEFPPPFASFYAVYTRLLHAFGPLLGLYASDAPFRGALLRLRLDLVPGAPGVVGELWAFPRNRALEVLLRGEGAVDPWDVGLPAPQPLFRVAFLVDSPAGEGAALAYAQVICAGGGADPHLALLGVAPAGFPRRKLVVRVRAEPEPALAHPDFPPVGAPWSAEGWPAYTARPVRAEVFPAYTTREAVLARLEALGRDVYYDEVVEDDPTEDQADAPAGRFLSLQCACPRQPDHALIGPRRFYPIADSAWARPPPRGTQIWTPRAPREEARSDYVFAPGALAGLWLGDYGPHGTEALHVHVAPGAHAGERPRLHARKLTGDANVPRGAQSWEVDLDAEVGARELVPRVRRALELEGPDAAGARVFSGWATISDAGFLCVVPSCTRLRADEGNQDGGVHPVLYRDLRRRPDPHLVEYPRLGERLRALPCGRTGGGDGRIRVDDDLILVPLFIHCLIDLISLKSMDLLARILCVAVCTATTTGGGHCPGVAVSANRK
jgi:hypothetical protein